MSAPAALAMSKLFYPETEKVKHSKDEVYNMAKGLAVFGGGGGEETEGWGGDGHRNVWRECRKSFCLKRLYFALTQTFVCQSVSLVCVFQFAPYTW